jgi:TolB-like protein
MLTGILLLTSVAADPGDAAKSIVKDLHLEAKSVVLVSPAEGPGGDKIVQQFEQELLKALIATNVKAIDREAMKSVVNEAALAGGLSQNDLMEIAGGFGAALILTSKITKSGDAYAVHAKVIASKDGAVKAAARADIKGGGGGSSPVVADGGGGGGSLQVQLRRLSDRLAAGLDAVKGESRYQTFAVLPFAETGATTQEKQLGILIASELTTFLHRDHGLLLVERAQLTKVIDELSLGQTGLVDEAKSVEVGKLAGAEALIIGSVSEAGDRYLVNAKVVSTSDARVVHTEQATLPAGDLVALSSDAVVLRSRSGAVYRSVLLPGWGQFYNRQPEKGAVFVGAEVVAAGLAVMYHVLGQQKLDEYNDINGPQSTTVFDGLADEAEENWRMRNICIAAAVGVHLVQIVDALISGKSYDSASPSGSTMGGYQP